MLAKEKSAYGGDLLKTRAGRRRGRPLSTRDTMHLVLRSTKAKGEWSFRRPRNEANVNRIVEKFSLIYGVRVISMANVGNHLHLQIKLANRFAYTPFIRAVTAAIAMAVTGRSRWTQHESTDQRERAEKWDRKLNSAAKRPRAEKHARTVDGGRAVKRDKFWDYRPYTRIVQSFKAWLNLKDYIKINELEGAGYKREDARFMLSIEKRLAAAADW